MTETQERIDFLKRIEIFQNLDEKTFSMIAENLIEIELKEDQILFQKGDNGDSIYIVRSGELEAKDGDFVIRTFKQGFVLGEFALLTKELRSASIFAKTNSTLLQLTDKFFFEFLMHDILLLQNILKSLVNRIVKEEQKNQKLLEAILPKKIADELKEKGFSKPEIFEEVSVLFTDFKGFTKVAETMSPQDLVKELDCCFSQFDKIIERYNLEKLKTIGDSYMCASGIPTVSSGSKSAVNAILAAIEIQAFMNQMKEIREAQNFSYWELRLGIHSGPLVAGVIGEKKFAYDVWGDSVNTASRMESSGTPGKINVSGATYELVKDFFTLEYRGRINAKNKGEVDMYYVTGIRPELSDTNLVSNDKFWELYNRL